MMITIKLLKLPICTKKLLLPSATALNNVRHGHRIRGKPPGVAKTIEQRFEMRNVVDPEISKLIDIGFPSMKPTRAEEIKMKSEHFAAAKNDKSLEKLSRSQQLMIDTEKVRLDWQTSAGQFQIKNIATQHGIYEHLFGYAYFLPRVPIDIKFKVSDDTYAPVYYGNLLTPSNAKEAPEVTFNPNIQLTSEKADPNSKWTLVLTNPDGHFKNSEKEYVHWFIGNIPGNDVSKGETIVPYMQPIPPKGTGYHRHVFILYKQEKPIDFSEFKCNKRGDLDQRTFSTLDFYRKFQDVLTPAGLAFFQADWDKSLTDFYHNVLNIKEPVFEYDFPQAFKREERWFPLKQPFNLYLDRYRDPKDVNKDFVVRRLKATDPFEGPAPPLKYPNAHETTNMPQWQITEEKKYRLYQGRVNEVLYPEDYRFESEAAREYYSVRRRFRTEHVRNPVNRWYEK